MKNTQAALQAAKAIRRALLLAWIAGPLAGCSAIDTRQRIEGWPELKVIEHHVSHAEMRDRCGAFVGPFSSPEGCAIFNFSEETCSIYVSKDFPDSRVLKHERQHCEGFSHIGDATMGAMLRDWRGRE